MINRRQYIIECLISTSKNYTCSNLATHLERVSHDAFTGYLREDKLTGRSLSLLGPLFQSPHFFDLLKFAVGLSASRNSIRDEARGFFGQGFTVELVGPGDG